MKSVGKRISSTGIPDLRKTPNAYCSVGLNNVRLSVGLTRDCKAILAWQV